MDTGDIPLMAMLKNRMTWLTRRQEVLSQNVASADVPGYTPRDLKPVDFESMLRSSASTSGASQLAVTNPRHIPTRRTGDGFEIKDSRDMETAPGGNSVSLETQMIKVAETQAEYQAAANIYSKAISMMRVAIGRGGG